MGRYKLNFKIMKKLSLLKLNDPKTLKEDELKKIKGGDCKSLLCQCISSNDSLRVDNSDEWNNLLNYS